MSDNSALQTKLPRSWSARILLPFLASIWCLITQTVWSQGDISLPALNDPPTGLSLPGKFIWFDLAAPDPEALKDFYTDLFGWTWTSVGEAGDAYQLIINDGLPIGGMFRFTPPDGEGDGAVWASLMSVENVDTAVQTAEQAGATVEVAPATLAGRGRHALLRDPAGALFGVLNSISGDPVDYQADLGDFIWVDLFARDVSAMTSFYKHLAPYDTRTQTVIDDVNRTILSSQHMPRASIVPVDEEANRSAWVPYVRVADVETTLERVVQGGGFAIVPPDPELLDGRLAIFVDPQGGVTGVIAWDYSEAPTP